MVHQTVLKFAHASGNLGRLGRKSLEASRGIKDFGGSRRKHYLPHVRCLLLACCFGFTLQATSILDPVIYIDGNVSSNAVAGVSDKGVPTSAVALKSTADYIARYDGPSEFSADYTIVLKADNTVDSSKSFVTFQTINYTSSGVLKKSMFKTFAIPITGVTLDGTGAVQTFQFSTDNMWYTGLPGSLEDKGLTGLIDLVEMVSTYTGTYRSRANGALSVYTVTGSIKPADAPEPGPQPDEFGDPEIFTPAPDVPEPTSWILAGGGLLATCLLRRRRMIADLTK